jgi:hypothetical protein
MPAFDAVEGSPPRYRDVPIRDSDGPISSYILAFAEGLELAIFCRQQAPLITTGLHPKTAVR